MAIRLSAGCTFEPAEDDVINPIVGKKTGSIGFSDTYYRRRSNIEDIADDFETRMANFKLKETRKEQREVKHPEDFTVSVAYNKSGYQLIPKKDLHG